MRILFITRNFPPAKGGMENVAFGLYQRLKEESDVSLLKYSGPRKFLVFVLPYFLLRALWIIAVKKPDIIYLNEGLLSVIGVILQKTKIPVIATVHGLDIVYKNRLYQALVPACLRKLDKIICISGAVKRECLKRGVVEDKICVIPDGFEDILFTPADKLKSKQELEKALGFKLNGRKVILSVCRLIERKGIQWFIPGVIGPLAKERGDFLYIAAGSGPVLRAIEESVKNNGLGNFVFLAGKISDESLKVFYNAADIFVMPNIPVDGDMEGFGITNLEAASCGLAVVASDIEGIKDALLGGRAGALVAPLDAGNFKSNITRFLDDSSLRVEFGRMSRQAVTGNFAWEKISAGYMKVFKDALR